MSRHPAPATRHLAILHSIVEEYIESGEPVASRTIAKRLPEHLSAASIRNIMADLDDEGYLSQPHTSAGLAIAAAIPTLGQTLDQVDLLLLAEGRVLMVVATRDRMVHNRVVTMKDS